VVPIEKPVLIAPENNASELLAPITLDWTGALDSYTLMYSDDYSALQNSTGEVEQTNTSEKVVNLSDGTWFWKVKGNKNGIETAYTDIRSFSVGFDSPPVIEEDAEATVTASLSETDEIILTWPEYKSENYQGDYVYYEYFIYEDDSEMGMRSNRLIENATCSTNNATFTPPGNTNRFRSTVLAKNGSNMQAIVGNNTFSKDKVADNRPPVNPYGPSPSKRENGVVLNPTLAWKCYDPDGNALEYDVYFGEAVNAMELVAEQITEKTYNPRQLESGQEYFWRIIVRESDTDKHKEKKSPIWSFETMGTDSFKISVQSTPSIAGDVRIGTGKWGYKDSAVVGQNEQVTLEYREDKDYTFAGWYDQGQLIGENNEIDILVNEDKEIFAKFIEEGQIPPKIQKVSESPTGTIQATSVTFEWTEGDAEEYNGNRVITEYFIRKDSDDWEKNTPALSTTYTWNDYDEDKHTFEVKAKDEKGLDSNILKWEFTHEASNTAPIIEKLSFQDGVIHTASTTFIWSAEDEDGEIDHYAYSKERGDWQVTQDTSYTWDDYSTGNHIFSVKAIDDDENESDVIRWNFTYTIEPATYTVTVESSPVAGGFIRVHSGEWVTEKTVIDEENTELTIEASPNSDYIFEGWQSDNTAISEANPYTFLADADEIINAVFTFIPNASPTVQKVDGPGEEINENTATFEWSGTDGSGERAISKYQYKKNEDAWVDMNPLTATTYTWNEIAEGDHTFSVRAVDDEGSQSNVVTWSFTYNKPEFTLTIEASPTEGGDVSFDNTTWSNNASKTVEDGTEVDIYAKTTDEYTFEGWYEETEKVTSDNHATLSVNADKNYKAVFSLNGPPETPTVNLSYDTGVLYVNGWRLENIGAISLELLYDDTKIDFGEVSTTGDASNGKIIYHEEFEDSLIVDFGFLEGYPDLNGPILEIAVDQLNDNCSIDIGEIRVLNENNEEVEIQTEGIDIQAQ